jgi:GxxExxY protein
LDAAGVHVRQQVPIPVLRKGHCVGEYFADLLVNEHLIVKIKVVQNVAKEHEVQLVHGLSATGIEDGSLINFGSSVVLKRKFRTYHAKNETSVSYKSS